MSIINFFSPQFSVLKCHFIYLKKNNLQIFKHIVNLIGRTKVKIVKIRSSANINLTKLIHDQMQLYTNLVEWTNYIQLTYIVTLSINQ